MEITNTIVKHAFFKNKINDILIVDAFCKSMKQERWNIFVGYPARRDISLVSAYNAVDFGPVVYNVPFDIELLFTLLLN